MSIQMPNIPIQAFDYPLPESKIAQFPLANRHDSKLLVFKNGTIEHNSFRNLADCLPENALLIFNNTKVIPARIPLFKENGVAIELFLLHPISDAAPTEQLMESKGEIVWECLVGNKKRWKEGDVLYKGDLALSWIDREKNHIRISWDTNKSFAEILEGIGKIPLPPYMERDTELSDSDRYQTLFSEKLGAVAAPTASLHFSEEVLADLDRRNIPKTYLTLHVGAGTFLPVKEEDVRNHPMHREQLVFTPELIKTLLTHRGPFIPVGTTALRALESLYWSGVWLLEKRPMDNGVLVIPKEFAYELRSTIRIKDSLEAIIRYLEANNIYQWVAETEILIMPGYTLHFCDGIITNFHQPKSTLLVLIAALIGDDWKRVYDTALANDYRFLSYGDSSLLFKKKDI
ncbi:S-adenosylmethionine:tRNA ribosyltransferase-isomerase [Aquirufa sp. KTFRIE-69F]|uniref:S-adenosylmethionine:tRNA ribosyltransferase-isomerase n=1 Tax=Aquirufa originis TaxID=3096514 RepID=A0ABW6D6M8_9BACT